MPRKALLFLTAILLSLTAGRALWVTLGESPFGVRPAVYVEFFQELDRRIAVPVAITGIGGTLLAAVTAVAHRRRRPAFALLAPAFLLAAVSSVVTVAVNVPINEQIATWDPSVLPSGYEELLRRWWTWHLVRTVAMLAASGLVFAAMLTRHD
jgi:uncharacterized membrane protein